MWTGDRVELGFSAWTIVVLVDRFARGNPTDYFIGALGSDVCFGAAIAFMMAGALTHNWGLGYWLGKFENRFALKTVAEHSDVANRNPAA